MRKRDSKGNKPTVIIRREEDSDPPAHGGAWKVAYADFVTAMMAFFLLMWLLNATTEDQRKGLADYFSPNSVLSHASSGTGDPFGGHTAFDSGALVSDRGAVQVIVGNRPTSSDSADAMSQPSPPQPANDEDGGGKGDTSGPSQTGSDTAGAGEPKRAAASQAAQPAQGLAGTTNTGGGPASAAAAARAPGPGPAASLAQNKGGAAGAAAPGERTSGTAAQPAPTSAKPASAQARPPTEAELQAAAQRQETAAFSKAAQAIRDAVRGDPDLAELAGQLAIDMTPEGLRIQILDQDRHSMFDLGSAAPNDRVRMLMQKVAPILVKLPEKISIAGYTDATPFPGPDRTNWELSTERANAARRLLVDDGLPETRIQSVTGHADRDPLLPATPFAAANRRIAIIVLREAPAPSGGPPAPEPAAR